MIVRKRIKGSVVTIFIAGLLLLSACKKIEDTTKEPPEIQQQEEISTQDSDKESTEIQTILIKDSNAVPAGVSVAEADVNVESVASLIIEKSADTDMKGLLRMPLPSGIESDEVVSAALKLKLKDGEEPALQIRAVTKIWDRLEVNWHEIENYIEADIVLTDGALKEGWYEIDVTPIVKGWFSGDFGNYGFLIEETKEGTKSSFYTPYSDDAAFVPELQILYTPSVKESAAPFEYQQEESGNCLSFALRDTTPIYLEDIGVDTKVLQQKYNEGKIDEAFIYVKDLTLAYIQNNMDGLKISSVRELESFHSEIDSEKEYRIALRIGLDTEEGLDNLSQVGTPFDYHLQAQLKDGSWAEKFGPMASRLVPGSNKNLDPGLYPWDRNEFWGTAKWNGYYNSKTAYFAITKDTDEFTSHR